MRVVFSGVRLEGGKYVEVLYEFRRDGVGIVILVGIGRMSFYVGLEVFGIKGKKILFFFLVLVWLGIN